MRLTAQQAQEVSQLARQLAGGNVLVRLFGSRLDDNARGGDFDFMLELPEPVANPALLAAKFSAQVSRMMLGRKVDVLIAAPNLRRLPIHERACNEGKIL